MLDSDDLKWQSMVRLVLRLLGRPCANLRRIIGKFEESVIRTPPSQLTSLGGLPIQAAHMPSPEQRPRLRHPLCLYSALISNRFVARGDRS